MVTTSAPELSVDVAGNPYVEVFFDPSGLEPDTAYIRVVRYSEGREWPVRGGVNIAPGVAALDFEAPFNVEATYRAQMFTATGASIGWTEASTTVLEYVGTIVHQPLDPTSWVPVDVMPGSVSPLTRPEEGTLVQTEGRDVGVWIGSGRRGLRGVGVSLQTSSIAEADAFRDLQGSYAVRQIGTVCIRTSSSIRWPRTFFVRGDFAENDRTVRFGGTKVTFDARVDEVEPPFPGLAVPLLTYGDLDAAYATYAERDAAYATYTDMDRDYSLAGLAG
ncbi:hypothetical protein [Microbacterium paraoxydans]|uniref:Uncharacterized protein n=1 Tax=Microbacterium paraoxydans TaxID=199592 RepID=A0A1H1L9M3_9MICO|nr:hypothetical protein [Microbacterium paraoxydans]SDR70735.1 hypothetical protein SAMN04489809_0018 [Microbacterium paraoxydans]SDR72590.1 hypothetical protein SAMN04489809_0094 [Microbacterium paraoxydans]